MTTIYLHLEETIGNDVVFARPPKHYPMTPAREALSRIFVKTYPLGKDIPPADSSEDFGPCDLDRLHHRIVAIAERNFCQVWRVSKTVWKITQNQKTRQSFAFPEKAFSGLDQTKWGPTDFYDDTRNHLLAALRSGLDFETPWMSCKKEILSSKITKVGGITTVAVSVSDDFDTSGMGEASKRIRVKGFDDEQVIAQLEQLGSEAWELAENECKSNATYVGWSVGPDDEHRSWVNTYLVNVSGLSYPPGGNYHRWGWQEAEDREDLPPAEDIPNDIARELAEKIESAEGSPIIHRGFRATLWK